MKRMLAVTLLCLSIAQLSFAQQGAEPTEQHKMLTKHVGDRSGTMAVFMAGPDADPTEMPFKETNTAILNGLWVKTTFEAGPYTGFGLTGYDPMKKKFVGTWSDNMSPHLSLMEGEFDKETEMMTMAFEAFDAGSGKVVKHRATTKYKSDKAVSMTMHVQREKDKWTKTFTLKYAD